MLKSFTNSISNILNQQYDLSFSLKQMRDLLKSSLATDNFRLACIEHVLDSIEGWSDSAKPWNAPPIFNHEEMIYSIRIVYWPAFYGNNPHQHKTWGLTGVFHNNLDVNTYELLDNPKRLKKERKITASFGEVGYLIPGCIHNVNNPSHELSASIHIFNNLPGIENSEENAIWYPSPRRHNLSCGLIDRALTVCLLSASSMQSQKAQAIIRRIYNMSSDNVKLLAIKSLYAFDRAMAREQFNQFELSL
jgi:predicted metal-dependent enzyme (double-stranded beta helix superfamily)